MSSIVLLGYHTGEQGPLGPAWYLDIELQFYLLAPALLVAMRRSEKMAVATLMILSCITIGLQQKGLVTFYLPWFIAGMLLASHPHYLNIKRWRTSSAIGAIALILLFALTNVLRPILFGGANPSDLFVFSDLLNTVVALLAIPFAIGTTRNTSEKYDRFFSDWSYSLYLFHWIPILIVGYYFPWITNQPTFIRLAVTIGILVLTYSCAAAITTWIDRPIVRLKSETLNSVKMTAEDLLKNTA